MAAKDWEEAATDFWIFAGNNDLVTVQAATNVAGLSGWGWTATSVLYTNDSTGDFLSSADDTPPNFSADANADQLVSPRVFGSYAHGLMVSKILGKLPTKLILEFYGAFPTASASEAATFMGLNDGGTAGAFIYSDGTNFQLSNGTNLDAGALIDNLYHLWKIVINSVTGLIEWFQDGVSQGTIAVPTDVFPLALKCAASTTNRWAMSWAHVWYE